MNKNCFANKNNRCKILKHIQCANNSCSFFKTEDEQEESLNKANARIASLDKAIQKSIADAYYNGKMPWSKGDK
ncbi:hypothetical protein [Clostridium botulinum]|uniref:hypothetical protein n=1 Tax=Clostridium botulinum TaxID=1491 RepID=UPI0007736A1C|nr:hypothetical protein [Clostridium botulinum]NFL36804.1 hypothetical protein [Clostridium botulinum]NFL64516.1 hypothetical protein [Clostridium botulinum]NFN06642.1 hypothetical protein [Clostridium botulinum]NFN23506.1 hypothetical protein [Clostridium botulinum]NFN30208.1 hypothetical protein [Clostridium botulinum]